MQVVTHPCIVEQQIHRDVKGKQMKFLCQMTELVLLLNTLYDCAEQRPSQRLDDRIRRITGKLDRAYDRALSLGITLNTPYVTRNAAGTLYILHLTSQGLECRLLS